ncbi:hypothetical protein CTTA_3456 [Comamonas testosteroni]|uniref:DUF91 domain-containing protein n=1 Tax=Comamonas testosteroni TaxID=285 RepID=A0A5A7MHM2_COMTE|nr:MULTISPECIES: hypothetical protein [Comamonas]BDR09585.1 endonuclease NucS [Comamonas thiooxydans]GEQ76451.1 hypothetical protein CTTA_3456 [Comamonas testosteroni]
MRLYRHITANDIQLEAFPFKRELSMEAYLIDNEGVLALDDEVFTNVEIIGAEIQLKQGQISKDTDGRIDILATYSQEYIAIVELKLGHLERKHLSQLEGYLLQKGQILENQPNILSSDSVPSPKWIGVLVGATIDSELANEFSQGYQTTDGTPIAALTLQRFRGSDGSVFVSTDSYFKLPSNKDATKYHFDGKVYGKGRLVLAIVKRYVELNPSITFAELERAFPSTCQGSSGVIATADQANSIYTTSGRKRHFLDPSDLIQLQDSLAAVSNQWGIGNIDSLVRRATNLGFLVSATNC